MYDPPLDFLSQDCYYALRVFTSEEILTSIVFPEVYRPPFYSMESDWSKSCYHHYCWFRDRMISECNSQRSSSLYFGNVKKNELNHTYQQMDKGAPTTAMNRQITNILASALCAEFQICSCRRFRKIMISATWTERTVETMSRMTASAFSWVREEPRFVDSPYRHF